MKKWPIEMMFWIAALVALAMTNLDGAHFSLCPLARMGWDWCPGCGLGRSITALLQGRFVDSFNYHFLGLPALLLIIKRIFDLSKSYLLIKKRNLNNLRRIKHV